MTVDVFFRAASRTIAVDAWDGRRRRRNWGITYLDPGGVQALPRVRFNARFLDRLRRAFA